MKRLLIADWTDSVLHTAPPPAAHDTDTRAANPLSAFDGVPRLTAHA